MTVTPWSSGLGVTGFVKACPGPVCLTSLFLFLQSLVSVSAALSFVSEVGISTWEFPGCRFRCGCKDKDEHCSWLPSKWFFSGSRITPVGKSLKAKQDPGGVCLSQRLPALALSPLYTFCSHCSHKIITLVCSSQRLNFLLVLMHSYCHHLLYCSCIHLCVKLISSIFDCKPTAITFHFIVSVLMSILRGVTKAHSWLHPWDRRMEFLLWYRTWLLLNKDLEDRTLNNARLICVPGK